jgi:predicted PurR-regulated permease PerM
VALLNVTQEFLGRLNITADVEWLVGNMINGLQAYATPLLQNTASVLTGILSLLGNVVLVILFSFFLALDGPHFIHKFLAAMPEGLRQETRVLVVTIDRAVGGFLRSQLLQAVAVGVATGVVMSLFGVQAALVSALFAGLFMLIPLIGPLLALIPPVLATLLTAPNQLFWVVIPVIVFSAIVVNGIIPRVVGKALGLHPLVVLVALLVGFQVGGFWGAFFAVPLAGIFFTFGAFLLGRRRRLEALAGAMVQVDAAGGEMTALDESPLERKPAPTFLEMVWAKISARWVA